MKDLPAHQLDPKVKTVWRINDAIWLTVVFLSCFVPFAIAAMVDPATWMFVVLVAVAVAYAACLIVWLIVLPPIRFMRWRYELSSDYLDIAKGIVWRKRFVIPFIRVQNTDTRQGPILRAFGLSSVTVATAAGEHEIPGLPSTGTSWVTTTWPSSCATARPSWPALPRRTCDDGLSPTAPTSAAPASARCAPTSACCAAA